MNFHTNIWYLVKTRHQMERVAEINLSNQSIEYFLPKFTNGKRIGKPIFPGYIFIKPKSNNTFQSIRSTKGIYDFIRFEMKFATLSDLEIDKVSEAVMLLNERVENIKPHKKGDTVYIKSGPFKDFNAIIDRYDANNSVIVLINFIRSQQLVKISSEMIC